MKFHPRKTAFAVALWSAVVGCTALAESREEWYEAGRTVVEEAKNLKTQTGRAKNVILFVGDGMGVSTVTAARILEGQLRGKPGEENLLSFERLPYLALSKVYNTNQQTPDSAGTMTAMMTGVKTKAGVISLDQDAVRGDCGSVSGNELPTLLEMAETRGMATGVVTTARLTHATPAATYAHVSERGWEDNSRVPEPCKDIARQLIEFPHGDGLEVALGGGRRHFLPNTMADHEDGARKGRRTDGRDLTAEWTARLPGSAYVWNRAQFDAIDPEGTGHLLGLFDYSHMEYEHDRSGDTGGEPSLAQMTAKAIDILKRRSKDDKGYFLMVESGRIDHGHHAGNAFRALTDTIEFANSIKTALDKIDLKETLVVVTADHSHVFTIAGYPTRGNPILGKVVTNDGAGNPKTEPALAADNLPYTTLGYTNGRGFHNLATGGDTVYGQPINAGRADLSAVDTTGQGFHQEALVPLSAETHAAEDVAIYAGGPNAHLFHGVQEQNVIFHVMADALGLNR